MSQVQQVTALNDNLRTQPWSDPTEVSAIVQETSRNIKTKLPVIQRSMQLYLANRDTEFILYRPIKVSDHCANLYPPPPTFCEYGKKLCGGHKIDVEFWRKYPF